VKRLLLLGGGHAHVEVVRAFGQDAPANTIVQLMSTSRLTPYSGMIPGVIAGHYTQAQSHIDLSALCAACGVEFVEQEACNVDPSHRYVESIDGGRHRYDLLSIDTGSTPLLSSVLGAQEHGLAIKPVERFLRAIEPLITESVAPYARTIAVVGAGAAGFEVVLALHHRLRQAPRVGAKTNFRLITETSRILPGFPARARTLGEGLLQGRGIVIHARSRVTAVDPQGVTLAGGETIPAHAVIFTTGAAGAPMYARCGLRTDERGFIAVSAALQSLSHPDVFASGDIASVIDHPRPKAGVFAVRHGPVLARNLRRALSGQAPLPFVPQRNYLVLLSTGGKHAIATRNGWTVQGGWVWRWKDWIDRRFIARFEPRPSATGNS
jgi:selenide,water dikinase